jgi:hypothetical protein
MYLASIDTFYYGLVAMSIINIAQVLAKWLRFGIKVGNLVAKNIFLDIKTAFFKN